MKWAKAAEGPTRGRVPTKVNQVLEVGDVVYVEPLNKEANTWRLRQVPEISGAIVVMDPWTGRVLAMVGGFSFDQSQFNRATQAMRQPGSSFKPFVYAAALDNGYTPSTVVMDAPIEIDQGPGLPPWRPENYSTGKYYGPSTLRFGIEHVAQHHDGAARAGRRHAADRRIRASGSASTTTCRPILSYSLGAGETTVLRMVAAYSMFDNGGKRIMPTFIDRIQDRYGRTVYKHDQRECRGCNAKQWENQPEPTPGRQARAGDRSDDRLPDHLDDGRRGAARHRDRGASRSASRSPARPAPPTTRRTSGSSASRRTSRSASISATTSRASSAAARPAAASRRRSSPSS